MEFKILTENDLGLNNPYKQYIMAKTLDDYLKEITTLAGGRDLSTTWYREQIRKVVPKRIQEGTLRQMIRQGGPSTRPIYGIMNLFYYMPKYEETLPYYDTFPLVIPIKRLPGGFLGLNFHYLSVPMRVKLLEIIAAGFGDESTTKISSGSSGIKLSITRPGLSK